jgi:hypothetical protein
VTGTRVGCDVEPGSWDFYREQGPLSDPGNLRSLYDPLDRSRADLARVVQGLLIAPYEEALEMYGLGPAEIGSARFGVRSAEGPLKRIESRHLGPLTSSRPPKDRIGAFCRNFTFLHVSMLRHFGIPARFRVGFAGYLWKDPTYWCGHRIIEHFGQDHGAWVMVDPCVDQVRGCAKGISVNTLDPGSSGKFLSAREAWRRCRAGGADPSSFGESESDRGMAPERYALLHDFAYLNKLELLGCDDWGDLAAKPEERLTDGDRVFLDKVAELTVQPDRNLDELRKLFASSSFGKAVLEKIAMLPTDG